MSVSAPPTGARFRAGEVDLQVEWDDAELTAPMEAILSYFGFAPPAPGGRLALLRFALHEPRLTVPEGARPLSESPEGLQFHRLGEALYLSFRGTVVHVDPQAGTARGTLATEGETLGGVGGDAFRDALLYCLFLYSALVLLYYRGFRTMHAACLVRDGHGCLFPGVSNSGKSTLALRLVEQGWSYLTDDSVLLSRGPDGIEARPLRRDFCIDPEAEAVFPQVAAHWEPHTADPRKRRLRIRELYPDRAAWRCVPRTLVFPQIVPEAESRLVPLDRKATIAGLLQHAGGLAVLDASTAAVHLEDLMRLAAQTRSYTLLAGRDLVDDPAAAAALMQRVLDEGGAR